MKLKAKNILIDDDFLIEVAKDCEILKEKKRMESNFPEAKK